MSQWKSINLGTNHRSGVDVADRHLYEVALFAGEQQVTKAINYESYCSFGTLSTFPQFDLDVKIRRIS